MLIDGLGMLKVVGFYECLEKSWVLKMEFLDFILAVCEISSETVAKNKNAI